jgi:hypothetical protein
VPRRLSKKKVETAEDERLPSVWIRFSPHQNATENFVNVFAKFFATY